jgi:hypothetical protein
MNQEIKKTRFAENEVKEFIINEINIGRKVQDIYLYSALLLEEFNELLGVDDKVRYYGRDYFFPCEENQAKAIEDIVFCKDNISDCDDYGISYRYLDRHPDYYKFICADGKVYYIDEDYQLYLSINENGELVIDDRLTILGYYFCKVATE